MGLFAISLMTCGLSIAAQGADSLMMVERIQGTGQVKILHEGKKRIAQAGETLEANEIVETDQKSAVRLVAEDGTHQTLGPSTRFSILAKDGTALSTELLSGAALIKVEKPEGTPRYRYFIRTPTAVIGVRGTEFAVEHDPKNGFAVHTLEGKVDVGQDIGLLRKGKGQSLLRAEALRGSNGKLEPKEKFSEAEFRKDFESRHPGVTKLHGMKVENENKLQSKNEKPERKNKHRK